jgi:ubiquinone/menaquinone biosynthesis C-methylase UbiE
MPESAALSDLPPAMLAMRFLIEARSPQEVRAALERARAERPGPDLDAVAALVEADPDAWGRLRAIVEAVEHERPDGDPVAHWARLFDRAVALSPEGSVALYSLGNRDLLARATDEIVAWLIERGHVGPGSRVLDVGCGIGRLGLALSPHVDAVHGLDISPGMIAEARRRGAGLPNLSFEVGTGRDLSGVGDGSTDLVAFVDSFPYLMLSADEFAARHIAEARRVLRPGGRVVILNLSYRGDPAADEADLARFANGAGLRIAGVEPRPFRSWDGRAFVLDGA